MSFRDIFGKNRQVIPRWHTYPLAKWLGVTNSINNVIEKKPDQNFIEKIHSWENNKTNLLACELVANALALNHFNDPNAIEAAKQLIDNKNNVRKPVFKLANIFLGLSIEDEPSTPDLFIPDDIKIYYDIISKLKKKVRRSPRNPIIWMDLAFYYAAIGENNSANKCVKISLSLNSENRYLLRSASRFFLHIQEPDIALDYLRKSHNHNLDPWLVAAEIAISETANMAPKLVKVGRKLLADDTLSKFHVSELASAFGTLEINNGSIKNGKKLIRKSLLEPTENTLAQVAFLSDYIGDANELITEENIIQAFEAQSRIHFANTEYDKALQESKKWLAYQPFSTRPALHGSYIACVPLGDYDEAIKIIKIGKLSSPNDFSLNNNHVFSLASLNMIEEATNLLDKVNIESLNDSDLHIYKATKALINFRKGKYDEGRSLYKDSIKFFNNIKDLRLESIAKIFWAREESIANSGMSLNLKNEALKAAKAINLHEVIPIAEKIK